MQIIRAPRNGDAIDARDTMYPSRLEAIQGGRRVGSATSTSYCYVVTGTARLRAARFDLRSEAGAFLAAPGEVEIDADGLVVVVERFGFRALLASGRIEDVGRLSYIDGCSDSVLCMPPRAGDPVLNHLHFPPNIEQTTHSHPSIRLGVVARGRGVAHGPRGNVQWEEPLEEGCIFSIGTHEMHAFTTGDRAMDVIAFHPDSDWGPTDGEHPMLNRTYLAQRR